MTIELGGRTVAAIGVIIAAICYFCSSDATLQE